MTNLLTDPLWQPADLGRPIPDSPHAVSVCLPTWADNTGYEEQEPRVLQAMQCGYPRFFLNPICRKLFEECRKRFGRAGESCLAFPSQFTAERFQEFLNDHAQVTGRIQPFGSHGVFAVLFPEDVQPTAQLGWQHCGGGISSRHAEACLANRDVDSAASEKQILRGRIAALTNAHVDDVYLFPCGMNAIDTVHRTLLRMFPERKSAQFGFPYVDTLKLLEKIGPGAYFYSRGNNDDFAALTKQLESESLAGVYTEFPSNPLLNSPNLARLAELSHRHEVPLVVDETVSGFANVELLQTADILCSSLTKFFSGAGDVAAGSIVLNPDGPFYTELKSSLQAVYDDIFWAEDARVLERNSRDYTERLPRINASASKLTAFLARRPEVESVFYPQLIDTAHYDEFRKPTGGYGGLFSLVLKDAPQHAAKFHDALRVCKGPNLGTNFTLACPFTILAHYDELDYVESQGVSRWLIRVSVGLEDTDDLIERFSAAF
jgi:cystathionine gamma-synthase